MKKVAKKKNKDNIEIDVDKGLVFDNEEQLYKHFFGEIESLEANFIKWRSSEDIPEVDFDRYEKNLSVTLDYPDEIWKNSKLDPDKTYYIYLKYFKEKDGEVIHMAITYLTDKVPSFVFLHFPTTDFDLLDRYCEGEMIYNKALTNVPPGAVEGDALTEGEDLALGLYSAMLSLRLDKDLVEEDFYKYAELREPTVEDADEIWRSDDSQGNVLVNFIKEFADQNIFYVVVTVEDGPSNSHILLFSFPTSDSNLVDRYRHGENLHAEEVVQESSH